MAGKYSFPSPHFQNSLAAKFYLIVIIDTNFIFQLKYLPLGIQQIEEVIKF